MTTCETDKEPARTEPVAVEQRLFKSTWLWVAAAGLMVFCAWVLYVQTSNDNTSTQQHTPSVIVIDVGLLQFAKKQDLQERLASYEAVMHEVDIFASELQGILAAYRDAGIVVINKNAVVSAPESLDVTALLADRLNIRLPN